MKQCVLSLFTLFTAACGCSRNGTHAASIPFKLSPIPTTFLSRQSAAEPHTCSKILVLIVLAVISRKSGKYYRETVAVLLPQCMGTQRKTRCVRACGAYIWTHRKLLYHTKVNITLVCCINWDEKSLPNISEQV